jgi:hypothetical protein
MNELPLDQLPAPARGLLETDSGVFLLVVGVIALIFVSYLVFDWLQGRRASRRLEQLRQRGRPLPQVNTR